MTSLRHRPGSVVLLTALATLTLLGACASGGQGQPSGLPPQDNDSVQSDLEEAWKDLDEAWDDLPPEYRDQPLEVGDCWGRAPEHGVDLDARDCSEPHVYEIFAVIDDFDPEHFEADDASWIETQRAVAEARRDLCEAAFESYLGYPFTSDDPAISHHGIAVDDTPDYPMSPHLVVCSAHSAPDVEVYRGEVQGSLADRGFTQ